MKPDEPAQNAVLAGLSESPFARLRALLDIPTSQTDPISLAVGSPRHKPPQFALDCLTDNLASYGDYPPINGIEPWQTSARDWLARRFQLLPEIYGAPHQVLPATGTREALFLAAQIAPDGPNKKFMAMPNPFYQLYAAATLSAASATGIARMMGGVQPSVKAQTASFTRTNSGEAQVGLLSPQGAS